MCNAKKSSKYKGLDVFIICDYEHSSIKLFSVFFFMCLVKNGQHSRPCGG